MIPHCHLFPTLHTLQWLKEYAQVILGKLHMGWSLRDVQVVAGGVVGLYLLGQFLASKDLFDLASAGVVFWITTVILRLTNKGE